VKIEFSRKFAGIKEKTLLPPINPLSLMTIIMRERERKRGVGGKYLRSKICQYWL
jgi:hypothetical protein